MRIIPLLMLAAMIGAQPTEPAPPIEPADAQAGDLAPSFAQSTELTVTEREWLDKLRELTNGRSVLLQQVDRVGVPVTRRGFDYPEPEGPVIVTLEGLDEITVTASGDGPRYTLRGIGNRTLDELREEQPEIHQRLRWLEASSRTWNGVGQGQSPIWIDMPLNR